jgi:hypothetical protein
MSSRMERIKKRAQEDAAVPAPPDPNEGLANAHYPCPVEGATLYGWTSSKQWDRRGEVTLLDHCEECGMAVTRRQGPPDVETELAGLERDGDELVVPNRAGFAAWLGAAGWADLGADEHRLHLTERAAHTLLARQGTEVLSVRTPLSFRSYTGMLQTMINAFTLRNNFWRHLRAGKLEPRSTTDRLAFALDGIVTVLVAVPLSVVALLAEGIASLAGRGDFMRVRTAPALEGRPEETEQGPAAT